MNQDSLSGRGHSRPTGRNKVFGVGWAKTGTTTLGRCLQILGYDHQSQNLSLVDGMIRGDYTKVMRIAAAKESFEDWPWLILYREMDTAFPGSRFILTTRDPVRWLASYRAMLAAEGVPAEMVARARAFLYGFDFGSATDDELRHRFSRHNADVCAYFHDRPGSLLVIDWEQGHGWRELCDFLDLPVPAIDFPPLNPRTGTGTSAPGGDHGVAPERPALPHDRRRDNVPRAVPTAVSSPEFPPLDAAGPNRSDSAPPFLMGFRGAEPEAGLLDTETLFAQVGWNTGNLAFCHAILSQLGHDTVSRQWDDPDEAFHGLGSTAILPMANQLGPHTDLGASCDRWERLPYHMVAIGLGIQSAIEDATVQVPDGTVRFLQLLRARAPRGVPNVSLRGRFSAAVLERLGFGDLGVTLGCPTLFMNPEPGLGRIITARRSRNPRHLVVCAGHFGWHHLAWIEQRLVSLLNEGGGTYVCQSPLETIQACRGEWDAVGADAREALRAYLGMPSVAATRDWLDTRGVAYSSVPEWMSQLRKADFVVGTRIHGVMLALQVGCRGLCIVHDARMLELCETMQVPWILASDLPEDFGLADLLEAARFDAVAFDDNRATLARRYCDFLQSNGISPLAWLHGIAGPPTYPPT